MMMMMMVVVVDPWALMREIAEIWHGHRFYFGHFNDT